MRQSSIKSPKNNSLGSTLIEKGLDGLNLFYGIYRGLVMDNQDPQRNNALKVWVPEVLGGVIRWAYPRGQQGGPNYGFKNLTPKVGEVVYITFEYGDASKPLWEPHGWSGDESDNILSDPGIGGFVTPNGNLFLYNEHDNTLHINFNGSIFIHSQANVVLKSNGILTLNGEKGTVINGGSNGGLVIAADLTEKLNNLVQELEEMKTILNTHTHNCTAPGTPSGPMVTPLTEPLTPFQSIDYENDKALH